MSLRARLLLGLAVPVVIFAVNQLILAPGFAELEEQTTSRNLSRARHAVEKDLESLGKFCHDWAAWDDTYQFLEDHNEEYVADNLIAETFANGNFDLCWIIEPDGTVAFAEVYDPATGELLELPEFPRAAFPLDHPLLASRDIERPVNGMLATSFAPMLASCWPVTDSLQEAPMGGWLLFGKFLGPDHLAELAEQTRVPLALLDTTRDVPEGEVAALDRLRSGESEVQIDASRSTRRAWCLLPDLLGRPVLLLRIEWPREISLHGEGVLRFALFSLLGAAVLTLGVAGWLLQRSVVRPLTELTEHAVRVGRSDDLSARIESRRGDELGVLAREFDSMMGKLATSRAELMESARLGGRAEVATSVLHNVGNVLNSVTVSAAGLQKGLSGGALAELERLEPLLASHSADLAAWMQSDPRGKHLPGYLAALAAQARTERAALAAEASTLDEGLQHVSVLVRAQEQHAGATGPAERLDLPGQVESALRLSDDAQAGPPIEVRREFEAVPPVHLPRHRLLEILVNLLRNARESLHAAPDGARRLVVRVVNGSGLVRIEVCDNGVGIAPENLARVFQPRYSTKAGGQGLGLHASANAARELGGSLSAHSEGPGRGATFVLELPLREPADKEPA
jgi:sensor domain CHASE-containing protein